MVTRCGYISVSIEYTPMAKAITKEAEKKQVAAKNASLVKDTVDAIAAAESHTPGFEPTLEDLMVSEIKKSTVMANRNTAKRIELESEMELDQVRTGGKPSGVAPMWGMGGRPETRNPVLDMIQMLPESERAEFIKERSGDLIGAMIPGNQFLQRIANTDQKSTGMGEMAQMMLAMTTANSEQQRNMLELFMTLQGMSQQKAPPENGGNRDMIQAMMAMTQAIVASSQQSGNTAIERMEKMYSEKAEATKEYFSNLMEMQREAYERQLQFMQQQAQRQGGGLSKEELMATLQGFKEATGVELKPDRNLDAENARYSFTLQQRKMELEQERYAREHEERLMAQQAEAEKWRALSGLGSALVDGIRLQKQVGSKEGAGNKLRSVIS